MYASRNAPRSVSNSPASSRPFEQRRLFEWELDLLWIEHLKRHHLMLLIPQMAQAFLDALEIVEEVGQDNDQAAMRQLFSQLVENPARARLLQSRHQRQFARDDLPLRRGVARLDVMFSTRYRTWPVRQNPAAESPCKDSEAAMAVAQSNLLQLSPPLVTELYPIDSLQSTMQMRWRLVSSRYCLR